MPENLFMMTGMNVHYVDFNRSGVPLIEIVSEPDMRSAEEVIAYLEKLRLIIQYLGASDCKLTGGFNESRCKPFGKGSRSDRIRHKNRDKES